MKHWIIYTLFLLIFVTGCGGDGGEPSSDASATSELGINLLVEPQQGTVSLKREGLAESAGYTPVSFGAEVGGYDLLRPSPHRPLACGRIGGD